MPINVFANSSSPHDNGNKIDTSLLVQKPYLRNNYNEANIEKDIGRKKIKTELKIYQIPLVLEKLVLKKLLIIHSMILVY